MVVFHNHILETKDGALALKHEVYETVTEFFHLYLNLKREKNLSLDYLLALMFVYLQKKKCSLEEYFIACLLQTSHVLKAKRRHNQEFELTHRIIA